MKLIADAGSTGTQWCAIAADGSRMHFACGPVNPAVFTSEEISETLRCGLAQVDTSECTEVHFYGAGCRPGALSDIVSGILTRLMPDYCQISVASDMLGAARAACGHESGIACILGSGSNSCLYNGESIVDAVPSLGYILGDEGSGGYLGRELVNAVFKRRLPEEICKSFIEFTGLDLDGIIDRVYRKPQPNTFLASLAHFIDEHIGNESVYNIVDEAFDAFFARNVARYEGYRAYPVNFVGSIAIHFSEQLKIVANRFECTTGRFVKSPLDGLTDYHSD